MGFKKEKEPNYLDEEIKRVIEVMSECDPGSDKYVQMSENLKRLTEAKANYETEDKAKLNPNTILTAASNLLGIGLILNYEKLNIITSKALSFIIKPKI